MQRGRQARGKALTHPPTLFWLPLHPSAGPVHTLKTCLRHLDRTPASVVRKMRFPSRASLEWDGAKRDGASQVDIVTWKLTSTLPPDWKMCFKQGSRTHTKICSSLFLGHLFQMPPCSTSQPPQRAYGFFAINPH